MIRSKNRIKRDSQSKILFIIVFFIFLIYASTFVFTFGWAVIVSLRDRLEFIHEPFSVKNIYHFKNYIDAFNALEVGETNLFGMLLNTLWYATFASLISVFSSNIIAYTVSNYKNAFTKFWYALTIFIMLIPIVGALPVQYILYDDLGILDSPLYLIVFVGGSSFQFILLHGFYRGISREYTEAAMIDGAGHWQTMLKVVMPMSIPMCLALGIIAFIGYWNDYMSVLIFLPSYPTLATGLYLFQSTPEIRSNYPLYYAAIVIATVPVVVLYAAFQQKIMLNTVAGGIKG